MTTLNLDSQCALAQGWKFHRSVYDRGLWEEVWILPNGSQIPCSQYRPSTDRNQAVDFAEWGCRTLDGRYLDSEGRERRFHEIRISWCGDGSGEIAFDADDGKGFEHFRAFHNSNQIAEALCRATLTALGKEK